MINLFCHFFRPIKHAASQETVSQPQKNVARRGPVRKRSVLFNLKTNRYLSRCVCGNLNGMIDFHLDLEGDKSTILCL